MKKIGIYKILNIVNNKVYIGSSNNINRRFKDHKNFLINNKHNNKHLQSAWIKYGPDNFLFDILEECDKDSLSNKEQYWITFHKSYIPEIGYNILENAYTILGYKHTNNSKNKMSISHKKRLENLSIEEIKKSNPIYKGLRKGLTNSLKQKEAVRNSLKTRHLNGLTNNFKKNILQYDLSGKLLKEFLSGKDAIKFLGVTQSSSIFQVCKGKRRTAYGYIWKYKNDLKS